VKRGRTAIEKPPMRSRTRLESDGILVREVVLRDIKLPEEYAKGPGGTAVEGAGERAPGDGKLKSSRRK